MIIPIVISETYRWLTDYFNIVSFSNEVNLICLSRLVTNSSAGQMTDNCGPMSTKDRYQDKASSLSWTSAVELGLF